MLDDLLRKYWGYTSFRPQQREAIEAILSGRDSVVVLPTGGGKSLCFQLPALVEPGTRAQGPGARSSLALVISPLIALMKDQVDGLVSQGISAACLHSGQTAAERQQALAMVREGVCRLLYVAPERVVGDGAANFASLVAAHGIRYVAVRQQVVKGAAELPPALRDILAKTELGRLTAPETTQQGVEVYALCGKRQSDNAPAKKEVRDEMVNEAFAVQSKKFLKELRDQAMIEYR